jgi:hypothetical protein
MFDYVNFEMPCPNCGETLNRFQTKDSECTMDTVEPDGIGNFYALCKCKHWVEFSRPRPPGHMPREKPLTREEVEALGFVLHVQAPNVRGKLQGAAQP